MAIITLNDENFREVISNGTVLVDFWATWCGPCRMQAPILEELAGKNNDLVIGKVDVDENPKIAQQYGVSSIPTLIVFKNGEIADKRVGVTNIGTLEAMVK